MGAPRVELTAHAYERIWNTLLETDDGREMGGPLLGFERAGGIIIDDAAAVDWIGGKPKHTPRSVVLNDEAGLELERLHAELGSPSRWLGEWHSHPPRAVHYLRRGRRIIGYRDTGGARPSPGDKLGWTRAVCYFGGPWVGLIVAPGASKPELGAWLLERLPGAPGARYRASCRPARVTISSNGLDPIRGLPVAA
jgi:hypothetical protein